MHAVWVIRYDRKPCPGSRCVATILVLRRGRARSSVFFKSVPRGGVRKRENSFAPCSMQPWIFRTSRRNKNIGPRGGEAGCFVFRAKGKRETPRIPPEPTRVRWCFFFTFPREKSRSRCYGFLILFHFGRVLSTKFPHFHNEFLFAIGAPDEDTRDGFHFPTVLGEISQMLCVNWFTAFFLYLRDEISLFFRVVYFFLCLWIPYGLFIY